MLPFSRVLVTGGAGFIGSHIVDELVREGCEVNVLDNFSTGTMSNLTRLSRRLTVTKGNINDPCLVKQSLKDIDVVFHEAAIVSVARSVSEPESVNHVNVEGTLNLLKCTVNSSVKSFIFASSAAVYGDPKILPISEDSSLSPISPYGLGKLTAEEDTLEICKVTGLGTTLLRYFNVYGPRSTGGPYSGVITRFAERLRAKESLIIFGSGEQTRDFIYVKDVVNANILVALNNNTKGKVFNVGTGSPVTIKELALIDSSISLGPELPVHLEYQPARVGEIQHSYANISLIRKAVGFEPQFSLKQGLEDYLKDLDTAVEVKKQIQKHEASPN
jgi:UDP-glucose 4-epimerase